MRFCAVALNYTRKVRRDRPGDLQSIIKSFRFTILHALIQSGARAPVVPPDLPRECKFYFL